MPHPWSAASLSAVIAQIDRNNLDDVLEEAAVRNGTSGPDQLFGTAEPDTLVGAEGADYLEGRKSADALFGGRGRDTATGGDGADLIRGGIGDDNLSGDNGRDTLEGGDDNDILSGGVGDDVLFGGAGTDLMFGGTENDFLGGGAGRDTINGGRGADQIQGGNGFDLLNGGNGHDTMSGDDGNDTMSGGTGFDVMTGGLGDDVMSGDDDADIVVGGQGRDTVSGGRGADNVQGNKGADLLFGNRGFDTITGGQGNDTMSGGRGSDTFVFAGEWAVDRITDFNAAEGDRIDLRGTDIAFSELTIAQVGAGTRIVSGANAIVLEGVDPTDVDADWFLVSNSKGRVTDGEGDDTKFEVPETDQRALGTASVNTGDLAGISQTQNDARFSAYDGSGYTVVVLDTGINLDHSAFGPDTNNDGISDRIVYTQDFTGEGDGTANDVNGHGSNVTSIIASSNPDYLGVAPGVDIIHLQVLSNGGSGSFSGIEQALQWVVQNADAYNVTAVNLSLGGVTNFNTTQTHPVFGDEFAALANSGVITTVAAGNSYKQFEQPGVSQIAADPNVIPVGAVWAGDFGSIEFADGAKDNTTGPDRVTSFSQRSADIKQVYAPGALIEGAGPQGDGTISQGGTSQAAPLVAGIAVVAQQIAENLLGRRLTPSEFHDLLIETSDTIFDGDDEDDNVANINANIPRVNLLNLAERIAEMAGGTGPIDRQDDFAGDSSTQGSVAIGGGTNGQIESGSDSDWFAVQLQAGASYRFEVTGQSLDDPFAALFAPDGSFLVSNDDANGRDPAIEFTASTSGRYFIAASSFGDTTGTYRVTATLENGSVQDDLPANDSTSSNVPVDGGAANGTIETSGDRDWHRLILTGGQTYEVTAEGLGLGDAFMEIFDTDGTRIAFDDNGGAGNDARILLDPKADTTYFVSVSSAEPGGTGTYAVRAATINQGSGDIPDDRSTTAQATIGTVFNSEIAPSGDRDWIAVNLTGGTVYSVALDGTGGNGLSDPILRILDGNGRLLVTDDDGGPGLNSLVEAFSPSETGTYFLSVGGYNDSTTGAYGVLVNEVQGGTGDIPANTSTTSNVGAGGSVTSDLEGPGDRDWHFANLEPGRSYRITLEGVGSNGLSDPYLRVYDTNGTLIAENDDNGLTRDSALVITGTGAADYYLSAGAYVDTGTGDYRISVTDLGIDDDFASDNTTSGQLAGSDSIGGAIDFAGDQDWISYFVEAGGTYQFTVAGRGGNAVDPTLTLRDPFGGEIAFDNNSGGGTSAQITFSSNTTGPIYLDIAGASGDTGGWRLTAVEQVSGGDDHPDSFGNNALLSPGSTISGEIEQEGDADVFRINAIAGQTYKVDLLGAATGNGTLEDSEVAIFDAVGNLVAWNDDVVPGNTNSQAIFTAGYTGTFYVAALGYFDEHEGTYDLSLTLDDFGEGPFTAGFDSSGFVPGTINGQGDRDWVAVSLFAGFDYQFDLLAADSNRGTLEDPFLRLYDQDGVSLIAEVDDSFGTRDPSMFFTPAFNGTYYLEASAFDDVGAGTWELYWGVV